MAINNAATQATTTIEPNHVCDNFKPIVPTEAYLEHKPGRPFCGSATCPCYGEPEAVEQVYQLYVDGLLSKQGLARILEGRTV